MAPMAHGQSLIYLRPCALSPVLASHAVDFDLVGLKHKFHCYHLLFPRDLASLPWV